MIPILIPYGHDKLTVERAPFVSIGIVLVCLIVTVGTLGSMSDDLVVMAEAERSYSSFFKRHPYLYLSDDYVGSLSEHQRTVYDAQRQWINWYQESPEEVMAWLAAEESKPKGPGEAPTIGDMMSMMNPDGDGAAPLSKRHVPMATTDKARALFLSALSSLEPGEWDTLQGQLDERWRQLDERIGGTVLMRFGYVPAHPSVVAIITHQFLHGGVLHLLFNMLMLWLAGPKLEDIWGRRWFIGLYLFFGVMGALAHHASNPGSMSALVGASGAIAGLMGAFLIRCAAAKIRFFYFIWIIKPKKGTFELPAYVVLPMWFVGQLFNAWFFEGVDTVAYWAHVGGFVAGMAVALGFKKFDFEYRVLGREEYIEENPEDKPLVAFQEAPGQPPKRSSIPPRQSIPAGLYKSPVHPGATMDPASPGLDSPMDRGAGGGIVAGIAGGAAAGVMAASSRPASEPTSPGEGQSDTGEPPLQLTLEPAPEPVHVEGVSTDFYRQSEPPPVAEDTAPPDRPSVAAVPAVPVGHPKARKEARTMKHHPGQIPVMPVARIVTKEIVITGFTPTTMGARLGNAETILLGADDIIGIAVGRVDHLEKENANRIFPLGVPADPAYVLVLVQRADDGKSNILYVVNGRKCKWAAFLPPTHISHSAGKNLTLLTKLLIKTFKGAKYIHGTGLMGPNNMPIYKDLEQYIRHIQKSL